jgi:hypothetical protein
MSKEELLKEKNLLEMLLFGVDDNLLEIEPNSERELMKVRLDEINAELRAIDKNE